MSEKRQETTVRRRPRKEHEKRPNLEPSPVDVPKNISLNKNRHFRGIFNASCQVVGVILLVVAARYVVWYLEMLHENLFWFSHIKEVEREISFRTEQGLYYSFYKQLVNAPHLSQGIDELRVDNSTEHGRTINILQRFNIYQEIFLAAVYKIYNLQRYVLPIMFYTKFVFVLQAFLAAGLYLSSWTLGRSFLAGPLALCLFIAHKNDASRVDYSVPLRECFSLPFIFCQMAAVTYYLKPRLTKLENVCYLLVIFVVTLIYTVTWQFAQFVSLLQSVTLFLLAMVNQAPRAKVVAVLLVHLFVMFITWILHFGNPMLSTSLLISFIPFAVICLQIKERIAVHGIFAKILLNVLFIILTIILSVCCNYLLKIMLGESSDQHIFKFIKGKLGLEDPRDFESRVYLCNDAFNFLDKETYVRLSASTLFPVYCIVLFLLLSHLAYRTLLNWEFPDSPLNEDTEEFTPYAYNAVQSVLFAFLGSTTRRMVCLWVPHMCVLAAAGITSPFLWSSFGTWCSKYAFILRRLVTTLLIIYFLMKIVPFINEQTEDLNEFWDPDTVELMEWIKVNTPASAAFAGSMQLMAGVKLCTGRPITNHPHFEDKQLRQRTIQIYQMYSKQPPKLVYKILQEVNASYIILEDSLCLPSDHTQCHLVDIMDLHNGHIPENGPRDRPDLLEPQFPRFCDQIRESDLEYSRFFKVVFTNKTFRIYKILR